MKRKYTKKTTRVKTETTDKAEFVFEKIISRPLTPQERGQIYMNLGLVYMQLNNVVNKKYDKILETVLFGLKKAVEAQKIESAKQSLG